MQAPKVGSYLAIPLQMAPVLFIAAFSLLTLLALYAGLFGIPLILLVFVAFVRYSFALLDSVTRGAAEPPVLTIEMINPVGEMRSLALLAIVAAAFFGTGAAAYWMGPLATTVVGLASLAILLAVIAVYAATGSLLQAVNPQRCVRLIVRLGKDFALIVVCSIALFVLVERLADAKALPFIALVALLMYAWLAIFALLGGVLHERRLDIGLSDADEVEPVELDHSAADERERARLIDEIYAEWRNGAHQNAWRTITLLLEKSADPLAELHWLYERISVWPDRRLADRLAQERLARLLAAGRHGETLNLVSARLRVNPDFRPLDSADLIRTVQIARDVGDRRIARALLKDFSRLFPQEALPPGIEELRQQLER